MKINILPLLTMCLLVCACLPTTWVDRAPTFSPHPTLIQVVITKTLYPSPVPSDTQTPTLTEPVPWSTETPRSSPSKPSGNRTDLKQLAIDDLAWRLQVSPATIQLVEIFPDEFPASNLGCPADTGTALPIPAIVTGQVIVLEYQEAHYIYHARATEVVYCGPE